MKRILLLFILLSSTGYSQSNETIESEIIEFPDVDASFPGGLDSLTVFFQKHISYPVEAIDNKIQGTVLLSFMVDSAGKISSVRIQKSPSELLTTEAIRIIQSMPNWIPATYKEKKCSSYYSMPINFTLPERQKK